MDLVCVCSARAGPWQALASENVTGEWSLDKHCVAGIEWSQCHSVSWGDSVFWSLFEEVRSEAVKENNSAAGVVSGMHELLALARGRALRNAWNASEIARVAFSWC